MNEPSDFAKDEEQNGDEENGKVQYRIESAFPKIMKH